MKEEKKEMESETLDKELKKIFDKREKRCSIEG